MDKKELRRILLEQRLALSETELAAVSRTICERISREPALASFQKIALYKSFRNEVDLMPLLGLWPDRRFYFPLVDVKALTMTFYPHGLQYQTNTWGLSEPEPVGEPLVPDAQTLVIVPALAYDVRGYRLGYGKGFYDRFLSGLRVAALGVCGSTFLKSELPRESHDRPVDFIQTETGFLRIRGPHA